MTFEVTVLAIAVCAPVAGWILVRIGLGEIAGVVAMASGALTVGYGLYQEWLGRRAGGWIDLSGLGYILAGFGLIVVLYGLALLFFGRKRRIRKENSAQAEKWAGRQE